MKFFSGTKFSDAGTYTFGISLYVDGQGYIGENYRVTIKVTKQ